jgi:parallel beta-helix repeat protein
VDDPSPGAYPRGMSHYRSLPLATLGIFAALAAGCGDDDDGCIGPGTDAEAALQTAFIEATAGDTICLAAGTFAIRGELDLDADGVTVKGAGSDATILDYTDQDTGAQGMLIHGDDVTIEGLQVLNTAGDGITADAVMNITFRDVRVVWAAEASEDNGAYGLYPVSSTGVTIDGCMVQGARDAGIYVGQSTDILVVNSEAVGNVAGIEIENSTDAIVRDNHTHGNTAGILIFNLPSLPVQDGARANVFDNIVEENDVPNFAAAGTIVSMVPRGTGVLVLASDDNEIHGNTITGNDTVGILVLSWLEAFFGKANDPEFDPYPQGNWFHDNTMSGNGTDPGGAVSLLIAARPVPDIVWDGCADAERPNEDGALTNCISDNGDAGWLDLTLCNDAAGPSEDPAPVTCDHEPLPSE